MGTAANTQSGPGILRLAPLGTPEPADLVSDYDAAWKEVGYTTQGNKISQQLTATDLEVEEENDPIRTKITKRMVTIDFAFAEITATNLQRVLNSADAPTHVAAILTEPVWLIGSTYAAADDVLASDGNVYSSVANGNIGNDPTLTSPGDWTLVGPVTAEHYAVEPPNVGNETRVMLAWDSEDGQERWIYREALQVGNITADRRKASLAAFTASFRLIKPASGAKLYVARFATERLGA